MSQNAVKQANNQKETEIKKTQSASKYLDGLLIRPIENGTVIDHITAGSALHVLRILGITGTTSERISVATNVMSKEMGSKDIVKIENRELAQQEVDRIALIAPRASINIVRNCIVIEKSVVSDPEELVGIVKCPNPCCITNANEPVSTRFYVRQNVLICSYCEWHIEKDMHSFIL
jgi:aspartate carbamoyltransferase regulatory subunit